MLRQILLLCGILSSLLYIAMNAFIPLLWDAYDIRSQTVSELSAIGAPTRAIWVILGMLYILLLAAFGTGVRMVARENTALKVTGLLLLIYCLFNFYWPPMQLRGNAMTVTDILHIVWAGITLILMMVLMFFGAKAMGKGFRTYTLITFIVFLVFGTLTGVAGPKIAENLPTPMLGIWERINIGAFMIWVIVFALNLLRKEGVMAHDHSMPGQVQNTP